MPSGDHFKRNSVSCPVSKLKFLTETGGLAPLRFKSQSKVTDIGLAPLRFKWGEVSFWSFYQGREVMNNLDSKLAVLQIPTVAIPGANLD